jgi:hypothetical protein
MRHHFESEQKRLKNKALTNSLYYFIVLLVMLFMIVAMQSCKSKEVSFRHYKKIAADIAPRSNEKRNIIAQVANSEFPKNEKVITKDSIIVKYKKVVDNRMVNSLKAQIAKLKAQTPNINIDSLYGSFYDSVLNGIPPCEEIIRYKEKETNGNDTLWKYFAAQERQQLKDTNDAKDTRLSLLNGKYQQSQSDLKQAKSDKNYWKIRFFALLAAIILGGIGYGYYKLKQSFKIIPQ